MGFTPAEVDPAAAVDWIGLRLPRRILVFYDLLFLEPVSPLVFIGGGVILAALYLYLQRKK